MKCLSLWQPWATLLVAGAKQVETRGWRTAHTGPLLIHAAKKWDTQLWNLCATEPFHGRLHALGYGSARGDKRGMSFGAIVGVVEVVGCFPTAVVQVVSNVAGGPRVTDWSVPLAGGGRTSLDISATERAFGDYGPGRWAWLCRNARPFPTPIAYRGRQQLFDVPDELVPTFARPGFAW